MSIYQRLRDITIKLLLIIPTVISAIIGTILFLIAFPALSFSFAIYKLIVILFAKWKFGNARSLSQFSSLLANGEINRTSHGYLSLQLIIEGRVPIDQVREEWTRKIMKKKLANGKLQFPELQKCVKKFWGYHFWLWDKEFKIENHIQLHKENNLGAGELINKEKLAGIRTEFQRRVFQKGTSPWEMLIVNYYQHESLDILETPEQIPGNMNKEYSVLIFKFHHALADGFSIVKLFWVHLGGKPMDSFENKEISSDTGKTGNCKNQKIPSLWENSKRFLLLPFYMAKFLLEFPINIVWNRKLLFDRHPWHLSPDKLSGKYQLWIAQPVHKKVFRELRQTYRVSAMSVIVSVVLGAICRMMKAKNLNIPKNVNVMFPIPLPNHPDRLTNHLTLTEVRVPFSNPDPFERLLQTNKNIIKEAQMGTFTIIFNLLLPLLTSFPYWFNKIIPCYQCCSIIIPSVPLPRGKIMHYFDRRVVSLDSTFYAARVGCGIAVSVMGHEDHFYMSLQIDNNLLDHPSEIKNFEKSILEELESLSKIGV